MRCSHNLAVGWMLCNFMNRNCRQIRVELGPVRTAIHRQPQCELGASVQHILVREVLAQAASGTGRKIRTNRSPCITEVIRFKQVWLVVIGSVSIQRHKNTPIVVATGLDRRNPTWRWKPQIRGDVLPFKAAVLCYPQGSVIRPCVEYIRVARRFGNGCS